MIQFRRHVPSFIDAPEPPIQEFDSVEAMLKDEKIDSFRTMTDFYRFSQNENYLLAEYENGTRWWVVGRVKGDISSLPEWKYPK